MTNLSDDIDLLHIDEDSLLNKAAKKTSFSCKIT